MPWPELLKTRKNLENIEKEIDTLLKNHNCLTKKEIARQSDTLLAQFDESIGVIKAELEDFAVNLRNHRNYINSKSKFIKRHYRRL